MVKFIAKLEKISVEMKEVREKNLTIKE